MSSKRRTVVVSTRVTRIERAAVEDEARERGLTIAELIHQLGIAPIVKQRLKVVVAAADLSAMAD